MSFDAIGAFVDKYGVSLFVLVWFMFRVEKLSQRNTNKLNKLIITNVVIAKTLNLDAEQERMIEAVADEDAPAEG